MDNQPFVSVVVATYNRKHMLGGCLDSLFAQSYPKDKYEVITVNDGSTDDTEALLREYELKAPCAFKWFTQENKGISTARNLGIEETEGEIICFTDDDYMADKDWAKNIVSAYDDEGVGGVDGEIIGYKPRTLIERYVGKNGLLDQKVFIKLFIVGANSSYRKDVLEQINGFDEYFHMMGGDYTDIGLRIRLTGKKLRFKLETVIFHRHRTTLKGLLKQFYGYGKGYAFTTRNIPDILTQRRGLYSSVARFYIN